MEDTSQRHAGRLKRARAYQAHEAAMNTDIPDHHHLDRITIDSELVLQLLMRWCWGRLSASELQNTCLHAHRDQEKLLTDMGLSSAHTNTCLHQMARLGDWGRWKGNIKRDLLKLLVEPSAPESYVVQVPVVLATPEQDQQFVEPVEMPFMLPHLVAGHLYQHHRPRFDEFMFGGPYDKDLIENFWRTVVARRDPRIVKHPICGMPNWAEQCIPISIHGDAVPCASVGEAGSKSFDCYNWQSLLARGSTRKVKQYIFDVFEDAKAKTDLGDVTMEMAWKVVLWSLNAALAGFSPKRTTQAMILLQAFTKQWLGNRFVVASSWCRGH